MFFPPNFPHFHLLAKNTESKLYLVVFRVLALYFLKKFGFKLAKTEGRTKDGLNAIRQYIY